MHWADHYNAKNPAQRKRREIKYGVPKIAVQFRKLQKVKAAFVAFITQIILFDIVLSIDSVITAIGMAQKLGAIIAAITVAMILMLVASTASSIFYSPFCRG